MPISVWRGKANRYPAALGGICYRHLFWIRDTGTMVVLYERRSG